MRAIYTVLAAILFTAASLGVTAQAGDAGYSGAKTPQKGASLFGTLDRDDSGALEKKEVKAAGLARRMDRIDENDNGKISKQEFAQYRAERSAGPQ